MYAGVSKKKIIIKKKRVQKNQGASMGACHIEEGMTYSLD